MPAHRPIRVLVADDDPDVARLIASILCKDGYVVDCADDGNDAFARVKADCPDIVVSDWEMPGMTGPELCRRIRELPLPRYVYFVLLTSRSADEQAVLGLDAGADDFITKPLNPAILRARLQAGARVVKVERSLRTAMQLDPLTGLLNRRAFHEQSQATWRRAVERDESLACVMIDLDFFKRVNDTYGHQAGDAVLKATADIVGYRLGNHDRIACRYGGEEFCLLIPGMEEDEAAEFAHELRRAVSEHRTGTNGHAVQITASFGVASRYEDTSSIEGLIELADQALAFAKESSRNCVVRYGDLVEDGAINQFNGPDADPFAGRVARDVMGVAAFRPCIDDPIRVVAECLLQLRIDSAPVVDKQGRLVGVISENDLMAYATGDVDWNAPIERAMKTNIVTFEEDAPAEEIRRFLSRVAIGRVIIVNGDEPTGVITRASLLRWRRNWAVLGQASSPEDGVLDMRSHPCELRERGVRTADTIAERLETLRRMLADETIDPAVCLVGEATRIQDAAADLLGHTNRAGLL